MNIHLPFLSIISHHEPSNDHSHHLIPPAAGSTPPSTDKCTAGTANEHDKWKDKVWEQTAIE